MSATGQRARTGRVETDAREVGDKARRAEKTPAFRRIARAGLVARAFVYLMLGGLAFEVAIAGRSSVQVDSNGAFVELSKQPGGPVLLSVLSVGLVAYACWRFVQTAAGEPEAGRSAFFTRLGWLLSGILYVGLAVEAIALLAGMSASGGITDDPEPTVATVLRWPVGAGVIGLVGAAVAAGGIGLLVWGVAHDYGKVLESRLTKRQVAAAKVVGAVGDGARGLVIALVAAYLFYAAVTGDPAHAKGLGSALQALLGVPVGRELVGVLAGGLVAFSAYTFLEARFRQI